MNRLTFPATLDSARRRRDKSITVSLSSTFEMSSDDFKQIDEALGQTGWILFAPNSLQLDDIPVDKAKDKYTWSQRLRFALKDRWQNHTDRSEDFEDVYYPRAMRALIERINED